MIIIQKKKPTLISKQKTKNIHNSKYVEGKKGETAYRRNCGIDIFREKKKFVREE